MVHSGERSPSRKQPGSEKGIRKCVFQHVMILFIVWGFREHLGLILDSAQRPHLALLSILCGVRDLSSIGCMQVKHLIMVGPTYLNFRA